MLQLTQGEGRGGRFEGSARPPVRAQRDMHLDALREGVPIAIRVRLGRGPSVLGLLIVFLAALSLGCMGGAWRAALEEDSSAGYHRFLREHSDSKFADEARERIDFHTLRRSPTLEAFASFREKYPQSTLLAELRPRLEQATFDAARAAGTSEAYLRFATEFDDGPLAARALGNALYLREVAESADPGVLREFAADHPESDFAAEAERSAAAFDIKSRGPIRTAALIVELASATPEGKRLTDAFIERAVESYALAGIRLQVLNSMRSPAGSGTDALLAIRHREEAVESKLQGGLLAQPGVRATTDVSLTRGETLVWQRSFQIHVESREHVPGTSVLFGSAGPRYWDDFFVPIASWPTRAAVRQPIALDGKVTAVEATGDRALVLHEHGGFEVVQIADPSQPVMLASYKRKTALERFSGIRILGERIAIYGEDGLELVRAGNRGLATERTFTRGVVGSVYALEPVGSELLLASSKGLLRMTPEGGQAARMMRRAVVALARSGDLLLVADEDMLFLTTLPLLREKRVLGQMRVGRDFATKRIRVFGTTAFVIGGGGVIVLDVAKPREPRVVARMLPDKVGQVEDIERVGSRIFTLGDRGVQLLGPRLDRVVEFVDADPGTRATALGRHLVTIGGQHLQVVDGLPFGDAPSSASRTPRRPGARPTAAPASPGPPRAASANASAPSAPRRPRPAATATVEAEPNEASSRADAPASLGGAGEGGGWIRH